MEREKLSAIQRAYNRAYKRSNGVYHRLAKRFGIPDTALWVLYALRESEAPLTQTEMCGILALSKQTVNSALKKLEEDGCLRLESWPEDRRSKRLYLTEKGGALAEASAGAVWDLEARAFLHLTEEERRELIRLEEKYVDALEEQEKALTVLEKVTK